MDDIPRAILSIPLYITIPPHPVTMRKRYALIHAILEGVSQGHVRMKTQWAVVHPPPGVQANGQPFALATPYIPGVTVFGPADSITSPVYVFVNYLNGKRIRPGLLITVSVSVKSGAGDDAIQVHGTVEINASCRTMYSAEIDVGDMVRNNDGLNFDVDATGMEVARTAILAEMRSRGESLGPVTPVEHVKDECLNGVGRRFRFGSIVADGESEDEGMVPVDLDEGIDDGFHTPIGGDEHCVDDMYA
uniref:Histidine protein kinase 1 (EC) n=1 Tax=Ganoderma boninense TaxID=34458 RepID=A0A5K1JWI5_9APHY|nr:Histidine protein kinase 1 (EC [Ganoderma boninense]